MLFPKRACLLCSGLARMDLVKLIVPAYMA